MLKELSYEELIERKETLLMEADDIEHQLDMASALQKKEGEYSDPEWYAKAKYARKCRLREVERINRRLSKLDVLTPLVEELDAFLTQIEKDPRITPEQQEKLNETKSNLEKINL